MNRNRISKKIDGKEKKTKVWVKIKFYPEYTFMIATQKNEEQHFNKTKKKTWIKEVKRCVNDFNRYKRIIN